MSNIFKKPKFQNQHGRNGFDMSRRRQFTAPCGMLLPVFKDFANPGDKYKLNSDYFVRTEALQTAAFMKLNINVDWFFVPITQLVSRWNEFFYGTNDVHSTAYYTSAGSISDKIAYPCLPTWNLSYYMEEPLRSPLFVETQDYGIWHKVDMFGIPLAWNFRRLWDLLGYGSLSTLKQGSVHFNISYALLDFLAYHRIFYSHYRLTDWTKNDPTYYNIDNLFTPNSNLTTTNDQYLLKIISTIHYRPFKKDFFTNIQPQPVFSSQFADYLNSFNCFDDDVYRSMISPEINPNDATRPDLSLLPISNQHEENAFGQGAFTSLPTLSYNSETEISATDIRSLFALDKLMRITASAGSHYDDQTLAHFGVKLPQGISNEVYYLGSQNSPLNINEVVASASTGAMEDGKALGGSTLGDIAGKGFASNANSQDISFDAPCHGFIMAIFSIAPDPDYASRGTELFNRYRYNLDFYHPEFDNLGMQPLFGVFNTTYNANESKHLNGWCPRWQELKTSFDVVNEGFWDTSRASWVGYKQSIYGDDYLDAADLNRQFYVMPQYTNSIFLQSVPFYSDKREDNNMLRLSIPSYVDDLEAWIGIPELTSNYAYRSDNFLVTAFFKCFKSSIMSVHSTPKFI